MRAEQLLKFWRGVCFSEGAPANEFQFFSIWPLFLKNIDLNKKLKFFTDIVYHSFNHFMYLPKLLAYALLILGMFINLANLLRILVMIFNIRISQVLAHAHTLVMSYFRISHMLLYKTVVNMIILELVIEVPSCQWWKYLHQLLNKWQQWRSLWT